MSQPIIVVPFCDVYYNINYFMSGDPARPPSLQRNGLPERAGGMESPLFGILQIREDETGLRYPPSLVTPLKCGAGPTCK